MSGGSLEDYILAKVTNAELTECKQVFSWAPLTKNRGNCLTSWLPEVISSIWDKQKIK
jgi:hypothetical protein